MVMLYVLRWDGVFKAASDENDQMSKAAFRRIKRLIASRGVTSRAPEGMKLIDQHFSSIDVRLICANTIADSVVVADE